MAILLTFSGVAHRLFRTYIVKHHSNSKYSVVIPKTICNSLPNSLKHVFPRHSWLRINEHVSHMFRIADMYLGCTRRDRQRHRRPRCLHARTCATICCPGSRFRCNPIFMPPREVRIQIRLPPQAPQTL